MMLALAQPRPRRRGCVSGVRRTRDGDAVGRVLADLPVAGGPTLYGPMQDGHAVLPDASTGRRASRQVATDRVRCVAVGSGPSMLVRPDGCLAWIDAATAALGWTRR